MNLPSCSSYATMQWPETTQVLVDTERRLETLAAVNARACLGDIEWVIDESLAAALTMLADRARRDTELVAAALEGAP